ncbi:MAG: hypothetical protein ACRC41_16660 [Sarcina sp.]
MTSKNQNEIQSFANTLNGIKYSNGDIIKIKYDSNLISVNIFKNQKNIGNSNGQVEYFEITNQGLVNITNKFISVAPLDILGNGNTTSTIINGTVSPNENVIATINGKQFTTKADVNGKFALKIEDANGFTNLTNISLSADGYIQTIINPVVNSLIALENSYINFYKNNASWEATNICSSIGFDVDNNTFVVNNYSDNFGVGNLNYFTLNLYNANGEKLFGKDFDGGSTNMLSAYLNGKPFNYGDIIELSYNSKTYKPIAVNGSNVIGNISGNTEYFEITKNGLEKVNFGKQLQASKIEWNNGDLAVSANLATGNSQVLLNESKKIVLVNSNNKVIASENAIGNNSLVTGTLLAKDLSSIKQGEIYTIEIEAGNSMIPIYTAINTPNSDNYTLIGSNIDKLAIEKKNTLYVNIKNSSDISSYLNNVQKDISSINANELEYNKADYNKVLVNQFINTVGTNNLESFYNESSENAKFLNWVLNNSTALQDFLSGSNPEGPNIPEGQPVATYGQCLQVWSNIWNTYTSSHNGFNLKLAIAISLTNGQPIASFPSGLPVGSPVQRYNIFEGLNAQGGMMPGFDQYDVSHLCYIVNTDIANDQIEEMRSIILQNHNGLLTPAFINDLAYTINYNLRNPHTGASVFGNNFYGPNPTIKDVWYDGGDVELHEEWELLVSKYLEFQQYKHHKQVIMHLFIMTHKQIYGKLEMMLMGGQKHMMLILVDGQIYFLQMIMLLRVIHHCIKLLIMEHYKNQICMCI